MREKRMRESRSIVIARRGIRTDRDFADLMSALMSDVVEGAVAPSVANAAVNAGGKLLKAVEFRIKYGQVLDGKRMLLLTQSR